MVLTGRIKGYVRQAVLQATRGRAAAARARPSTFLAAVAADVTASCEDLPHVQAPVRPEALSSFLTQEMLSRNRYT